MSHGDDGYDGAYSDYSDDHPGEGHRTRTRLPERSGVDVYGGAKRSVRSSKSLVTVVGVVVLLIAAIAFANRGGGSGDDSGSGSDTKGGEARPTAPTGERPVTGSKAGIASGFPKTEQGAESAAANYAVALGGDGMFRTESRHRIVGAVYAPDVAEDRQKSLDKVYSKKDFLTGIGLESDGTAPDGMTFISRTNPVGTKLESLKGDTASVAVWYSALSGVAGEGSENPVTESWYTNTFELKWVNDDWKIVDFDQKEGPTPIGQDQTASSAEEMADAVEGFGGFTYAR